MVLSNEKKNRAVLVPPTYDVYEPTRLPEGERKPTLEVNGQGTICFSYERFNPPQEGKVSLCKRGQNQSLLELHISDRKISISGESAWRLNCKEMVDLSSIHVLYCEEPCKYLWVSIDKNRPCIKVGHGYMLESNCLVRFAPKNPSDQETVRKALEEIEKVKLGDMWRLTTPLKYWRLPVTRDPPPLIAAEDTIALTNLHSGETGIPSDWLPHEAKRLYSAIKSNQVALTEDQIKWINYSLDTKGCILNEKAEQKQNRSNVSYDKKTSYIRIGMGDDGINSPGEPFVLEIWPQQSQSPVHQHGDAAAVIKVLHGTIEVSFYNPLSEDKNYEMKPIRTVILKKGDITWMTPEFYQTHTIRNICENSMSATIQCYIYMGTDQTHNEHFDYVSEMDGKLHHMRPKSDFRFADMINTVHGEYLRGDTRTNDPDKCAIM